MGRSSQETAARNRANIVKVASRLFRQHGVENVSVAEVMSLAGMTAGGFYKHFASKEALVAEAMDFAFSQADAAWARLGSLPQDPGDRPLTALVRYYFTYRPPEDTCPLLAFADYVALGAAEKRSAGEYEDGAERLYRHFRRLTNDRSPAEGEPDDPIIARANLLFAAMIGAGLLSRATERAEWVDGIQDAILRFAREDGSFTKP